MVIVKLNLFILFFFLFFLLLNTFYFIFYFILINVKLRAVQSSKK